MTPLQREIESAIRRELVKARLLPAQIDQIIGQLRAGLETLQPKYRASGLFISYVRIVEGIVAIVGAGPEFAAWRKDVYALIRRWQTRRDNILDAAIPAILATRGAKTEVSS